MFKRSLHKTFMTLLALGVGLIATAADASVPRTVVSGYTHQTAPTQYVNADGIRFAYRRFGHKHGVPLVMMQHFLGNMDNWDPAITDGLAAGREVIIFDNAGISSSSGKVPDTIGQMAKDAESFIAALKLSKVDLLGFSMGGLVAQQVVIDDPSLVRRLVLVGTGPRGGEHMATQTPESEAIFGKKYASIDDMWLAVFFTPSPASQAAGRKFIERYNLRKDGRDPPISAQVGPAQLAALAKSGADTADRYAYLKTIQQPTLVVSGSNDVIIYTVNSYVLQQNIPHAKLVIYPDTSHGSLFQYPTAFVADTSNFLDSAPLE